MPVFELLEGGHFLPFARALVWTGSSWRLTDPTGGDRFGGVSSLSAGFVRDRLVLAWREGYGPGQDPRSLEASRESETGAWSESTITNEFPDNVALATTRTNVYALWSWHHDAEEALHGLRSSSSANGVAWATPTRINSDLAAHFSATAAAGDAVFVAYTVRTSQGLELRSVHLGTPPTPSPTNTAPPTISGTAQQGQTLTASPGGWRGVQLSYSYQWQRCSASGGSCSAIAGATGASYTLTASDAGKTIRVAVSARNPGGTSSATSNATGIVAGVATSPPRNVSLPAIAGIAQEGQTLSATLGNWSGRQPISFSYQWQRCDPSGTNCSTIAGASGGTYTLTTPDIGYTLRFLVLATNADGSGSALSPPTALVGTRTIAAAPPPPPPPPAVTPPAPPPAQPTPRTPRTTPRAPRRRTCLVPNVRGKPLATARRALARAGCRTGKIRRAYSTRVKRGRVIGQRPRAGARLRRGTRVSLLVSRGRSR